MWTLWTSTLNKLDQRVGLVQSRVQNHFLLLNMHIQTTYTMNTYCPTSCWYLYFSVAQSRDLLNCIGSKNTEKENISVHLDCIAIEIISSFFLFVWLMVHALQWFVQLKKKTLMTLYKLFINKWIKYYKWRNSEGYKIFFSFVYCIWFV